MTKTLIQNGRIVNEGKTFEGYIVIDNGLIDSIGQGEAPCGNYSETVDATGCDIIP